MPARMSFIFLETSGLKRITDQTSVSTRIEQKGNPAFKERTRKERRMDT